MIKGTSHNFADALKRLQDVYVRGFTLGEIVVLWEDKRRGDPNDSVIDTEEFFND